MQQSTVIDAIYQALNQQLNIPQIAAFHEHARLNEDLYLDSVLVLQLLLSLELELGINIPDSALNSEDFATVSSLADFLLRQQSVNSPDASLLQNQPEATNDSEEEFEDIKVHCFVSCVCDIIKNDPRVDHRPFYFGVWDAEIVVDKNFNLAYHSADINHDFFISWYQRLYGAPITSWYDPQSSKACNINTFLALLNSKTETQRVMVMLDMFRLPERENKFNQNPFPHYVMLEKTADPDNWLMRDPDFRWEGLQNKSQVLNAIASDAVAGGYHFDSKNIKPTSDQAVHDYFIACFQASHNPMTDSVRAVINAHTKHSDTAKKPSPNHLTAALTQLPVLAIRKYAYEHGFAFFWRELNLDDQEFESWCDVIEELVSGYKQIQFRAMKVANRYQDNVTAVASNEANTLSITAAEAQTVNENAPFNHRTLLTEIDELLIQQDQREFRIKKRLHDVFLQWCQAKNIPHTTEQQPQLVEASS